MNREISREEETLMMKYWRQGLLTSEIGNLVDLPEYRVRAFVKDKIQSGELTMRKSGRKTGYKNGMNPTQYYYYQKKGNWGGNNKKYTPEQEQQIITAYFDLNLPYKMILEQFSINKATLQNIVNKAKRNGEKRYKKEIEYCGEKHTIPEWAKIIGVSVKTLYSRINNLGWSVEKALSKKE